MKKVLIVDDEENIVNVLQDYLEFSGYETDFAYDGMQAVDKVIKGNFDCVLMDIMMPKMDGYTAVKEIRKHNENIPIIMMSAKGEEYDKLTGFEIGIDDYIVKPFSLKEVGARIFAVIKRYSPKSNSTSNEVKEGEITINTTAHSVYVQGKEVKLTNKEYELLLFLMKNKNQAFSREDLGIKIWGEKPKKEDRTLDTHIKMLRAHLGTCGDKIITIRGVGYKFEN